MDELEAEHGTKWRKYTGGAKMYEQRKKIGELVQQLISNGATEEAATQHVQDRMHNLQDPPTLGRGRKTTKANGFHKLIAQLREEQPKKKRRRNAPDETEQKM